MEIAPPPNKKGGGRVLVIAHPSVGTVGGLSDRHRYARGAAALGREGTEPTLTRLIQRPRGGRYGQSLHRLQGQGSLIVGFGTGLPAIPRATGVYPGSARANRSRRGEESLAFLPAALKSWKTPAVADWTRGDIGAGLILHVSCAGADLAWWGTIDMCVGERKKRKQISAGGCRVNGSSSVRDVGSCAP